METLYKKSKATKRRMKVNIVVCCDVKGNIGRDGDLPWDGHFKHDMQNFTRLTTGEGKCVNGVLMGRKTWESLPERHRPLRARRNYILSSTLSLAQMPPGTSVYPNFDVAIAGAALDGIRELWVIGGQALYMEAMARPDLLSQVWVTIVNQVYPGCDTRFPLDVLHAAFPAGPTASFPYKTDTGLDYCVHSFCS